MNSPFIYINKGFMNKKLFFSVLFTFIYAVITLVAVMHHEIWADEAQVWMLCKHLSIPELINHLHNEGHPSLIYLITMPFAKHFSNIIYMQLICWFAMCFSVFLIMYKSPFPLILKLAICSSAGFLYFLPVIARSYSIIPVLVFLAAILYSKRKENPILYAIPLFLLANTHAIMFGFVAILFLIFLYEIGKEKNYTKTNIISAIIIFMGLIAVVLQLHNTTSSNMFITFKQDDLLINFVKVPLFFFINAYNKAITVQKYLTTPIFDITAILTLITTFIILFVNLYLNNKKLFLIGFLGIGFQFGIYIFTYSANTYVTRIFSALIILIFCFWILYEQKDFNANHKISTKKITTILLSVFFFLTSYNGINYWILDYKYNYAGAKETAEFIKANIPKDAKLLTDNEAYTISLAYYLKDEYKLISVSRNKQLNYVIWDKINGQRFTNKAWKQYCKILTDEKIDDIYLVRSYSDEKNTKELAVKIESEYGNNFKLIFSSTPAIEPNEGYRIYKFIKD